MAMCGKRDGMPEQKVAGERLRSGNTLPQFPEDSSRDFRSILDITNGVYPRVF
jgi:hypothetical protein